MISQPRIYLAGPGVFRPDAREYGRSLVGQCLNRGMIGLFPLDVENPPPHRGCLIGGMGGMEIDQERYRLASGIRQANMTMLISCDGVIADMTPFRGPSTDPGTAYEMGVAAAYGKPVVGWTTAASPVQDLVNATRSSGFHLTRGNGDTFWDEQGLLVEDFGLPDNLMMACGIRSLENSFTDALDMMRSILSKNGLIASL